MSERAGSLMRFQAACGHWTVCYSLEPTPQQCPDCHDEARQVITRWKRDISSAESHASDCAIDDVQEWLSEDGIELPDDILSQLQAIADQCNDAWNSLDDAETAMRTLLQKMPKAERLTMPEEVAS